MKLHRAYGCARGVESWWPLCDHWQLWVPDHDPLPAIQAHLGAIAAGGAACMGVGVGVKQFAPVLAAIQQAAGPRIAFNGGEDLPYAAIWCSQQHQDWACRDRPLDAWDQWHGMNEFCRHAHLQSSVVFDEQMTDGTVLRYPVLLAGETRCVSAAQVTALRRYVERGGVLVACRDIGTLDEWGEPHPRPALDDLLGVTARRPGAGCATFEVLAPRLRKAAGPHVTVAGAYVVGTPAAGVNLLAHVVERSTGSWDGGESGEAPAPRSPGLWTRRVGRGWVVWLGVDFFSRYLAAPTPQMRAMLRHVLTRLSPPAATLEGPLHVTVNVRRRADGLLQVHLHNCPGSAYNYPVPPRWNFLHTPGEVVPVHDLRLHLRGMAARAARSGLSGRRYAVTGGGHRIVIPQLALHEVMLIRTVPD